MRELLAFAEMRGDADYTSDSDSDSEMTYDLDGTGSEVSSATEGASPVRWAWYWLHAVCHVSLSPSASLPCHANGIWA